MLIDRTYFVGELAIPNVNQPATGSLLDWFISKYEPEFLEKALGYSAYKALVESYQSGTPAQKWVDLVQGVEYTGRCGTLRKWKGLVTGPVDVLNAFDVLQDKDIVVGRGGLYDPTPGSNTTILPPEYIGKPFRLYQRGFGQLRPDEYTITADPLVVGQFIVTLLTTVFAVNDTYFYKTAELVVNTTTGGVKESPIANYVYYWYGRNIHTQTTSMGETKTTVENADSNVPPWKLVKAWDAMSRWVFEMYDYLYAKKDEYTEWQYQHNMYKSFQPQSVNEFNF